MLSPVARLVTMGAGASRGRVMWIVQIVIAAFWWHIGFLLLFREALVWRGVEDIAWFRQRFGSGHTRGWERFCRHGGVICVVAGCLLFLKLPFGMGALGVFIALPPLIFLL